MTPAEISDLAASATEREIENMKRNPIVKKIVAKLEAENEQLKADVAELKSRLAEPPKKRATK